MYNLVNTNFNRTYNPTGNRNALSDIKRLLTSRDTVAQTKACGYVIEVIKKYSINSIERARMVEYLLENDIVVFLCEATSNLSIPLFRLVLDCIRSLWCDRRFFAEEHAAHAMAAVLRSLAHYLSTDMITAVDACLHFLCDLLNGISSFEALPALSHHSAYSIEQLLACLQELAARISGKPKTILSSALVVNSLITYQPNNFDLRAHVANKLFEVLNQWFNLLLSSMNHTVLVEDNEEFGIFLVVVSQLGIDILRLLKVLEKDNTPSDFIQTILTDDQELQMLKECLEEMKTNLQRVSSEVAVLVKDNQDRIKTEEYNVFLKFLMLYLTEKSICLESFCDVLLTNGYLEILPQYQITRNDKSVRKLSTLVLGEILKVLAGKYLSVDGDCSEMCAADIRLGLVDLQNGAEDPEALGLQLQKTQPYSVIIHLYFYCQSLERPQQCTAALLPHLVKFVLRLSSTQAPPLYIVKALWLIFAMAVVSSGSGESLDERLDAERAAERLGALLQPATSNLYTHHPAILLWTFTTTRIPYNLRLFVLSEWLKIENTLPEGLADLPAVWELLLNALLHSLEEPAVTNCMDAINFCLENADDAIRQDFANLSWSLLPSVLSRTLIDSDNDISSNICYLLEIVISQLPAALEPADCLKVAVLITTLFSKTGPESMELEFKYRYEYATLKLCLMLLEMSQEQNDNKVLLTLVNRPAFLPRVLTAVGSCDDDVACAACRLLSHTVLYFTRNKYQPKSALEIQTDVIIKSLRRDHTSDRGVALLHLIYTVLSTANTPLLFTSSIDVQPSGTQQCNALRALLFRVQLMLCCENVELQSPMGWKALNSIFKHAIVYKNDPGLVAALSTQPWTFTLIRFQITHNTTKEFTSFMQNWLTLLKITITKYKDVRSVYISKYSLVKRTLILVKRYTGEGSDDGGQVLAVADEILNDLCNK